ncbi:unnamed protein product [Phytophthora fragariaefolia]|uniref:Unnamed protein product n=1 Tax=Phytophthora fragariaefolia TaxID=1490495 RepID=A0A9W6YN04_9STRA|nr:unnamed protein product [Phytophthora fragariaefolia]
MFGQVSGTDVDLNNGKDIREDPGPQQIVEPVRQVDIITVPKPKGRGKTGFLFWLLHWYGCFTVMVATTLLINSNRYVQFLSGFYAVKAKGRAYFEDRKWLEQDWRKNNSDVALLLRKRKRKICQQALCAIVIRSLPVKLSPSFRPVDCAPNLLPCLVVE